MIEHMFDTSNSRTIDEWEQLLLTAEAEIGRLRAAQATALRALDAAQVARGDGARSLHEWVAGRIDVSHDAAKALVSVARSMPSVTATSLLAGEVGFERAVEETRLHAAGIDADRIQSSRGRDLNGVRRLAARHRRITPCDEADVMASQHVVIQPNLDETAWTFHGLLAAVEGRIVEKALHQRGDELVETTGVKVSRGLRSAMALASICQDSLDGGEVGSGSEPLVTIMLDAAAADGTFGESGASVVAGPRVGPNTLHELLCTGRVEVNATIGDGTVLGIGATANAVPPRLRRHVLARDGGCVIAGCRSRYRLQPHHIRHRAQGGDHSPGNLSTLCWFHHHVAIHGLGFSIDPDSPPGRRRLRPPP